MSRRFDFGLKCSENVKFYSSTSGSIKNKEMQEHKSSVPCTKVLSQSTSGFGIFTPFDRSRRARACDVSFSNFATQEKL